MSDESGAPAGSDAAPAIISDGSTDTFANASQAAEAYVAALSKKSPAESADDTPATAEPELSEEDNVDPVKDPGEAPEEVDPAEVPPIERPRSWAKELDEEWSSYPRAAQEKIVAREQERDAAIRRSQNEAAEVRKAAEVATKQAEEARKAYEAKLPALMESLQRQSQFSDIKSIDDVRRMQAEDPFRFQAWQVYQMDAQAVESERQQAEQRQIQQKQSERSAYERAQNAKLLELLPEMKEPAKASELRTKAVAMLTDDYGFTESELGEIMKSDDGFKVLTDARFQKLIADGLALKTLRSAPPKAVAAKLPPVQRPGVAKVSTSSVSEREQALSDQFNKTGSLKVAQELYALQSSKRRAS